jgi:hypothetical protein
VKDPKQRMLQRDRSGVDDEQEAARGSSASRREQCCARSTAGGHPGSHSAPPRLSDRLAPMGVTGGFAPAYCFHPRGVAVRAPADADGPRPSRRKASRRSLGQGRAGALWRSRSSWSVAPDQSRRPPRALASARTPRSARVRADVLGGGGSRIRSRLPRQARRGASRRPGTRLRSGRRARGGCRVACPGHSDRRAR